MSATPSPDPVRENAEILRDLVGTPLVGEGLRRAAALVGELRPDPARPWILPAWQGTLLLFSGELGATDLLLQAARLAEAAGEPEERLRCTLLCARGLARVGRTTSGLALLEPLAAEIARYHLLSPDHNLALAALGHPDTRRLWEEALPRLPSPARDADRLEVLLGLGLIARSGGDPGQARRLWEQALSLARAHQDDRERLRLAALLGNVLVESGLPREAEGPLAEVVALAERLDEPLLLLAEGTLLTALQLGREDWAAAQLTAERCARAAATRNNPPAIAGAAIDRAAARQGQGDLAGAIQILWEAAALLRDRGSAVGLNLLKARLAELRTAVGPAAFDPLWMAVAMPKPA